MTHPYTEFYPETHGHFAPTRFVHPAYSAACVPFRWMLRDNVEGAANGSDIGIAERLKIGWVPDREPDIRNHQGKEVKTAWLHERESQLAFLDTFLGALLPAESLCFFYAKRTRSRNSRGVSTWCPKGGTQGLRDSSLAVEQVIGFDWNPQVRASRRCSRW